MKITVDKELLCSIHYALGEAIDNTCNAMDLDPRDDIYEGDIELLANLRGTLTDILYKKPQMEIN